MRLIPVLVLMGSMFTSLASGDTRLQQTQAPEKKAEPPRKPTPPTLKDAQVEVYKTVGDVKLNIYAFLPKDHKPSDKRPAIVFFHGGGWSGGSPGQFERQCKYFASRGLVALTAQYRLTSQPGVKAAQCVADAKSAVRWVRANAARLGIDPERIVASGGSAGGHLAACTGLIDGFDEKGEGPKISSRPNALVLFNPSVVLAPYEDQFGWTRAFTEHTGVDPKELSPLHHVKPGQPPTLILQGTADRATPYAAAQVFARVMKEAKNRCELEAYEGQEHGFFNYGRDGNKYLRLTLTRADEFLASLGYLKGPATAAQFEFD